MRKNVVYFQWKLMTNYTFKHMDIEKPKKPNYGLAVCQGKRASFLNTLKTVANLCFCSQKDIRQCDIEDLWDDSKRIAMSSSNIAPI